MQAQLKVLGWRSVPVDSSGLGSLAVSVMPAMEQVFIAGPDDEGGLELERRVWLARKRIERTTNAYPVSLSARTITYKGMLTTTQLPDFFPDLRDEQFASTLAVVHSRFSTNTFPSWPLAHPYRLIAHNGEINTVRGNRNWMHARESILASDVFPGDIAEAFPICTPEASDSASFDEVLELLHLGGRSLPHSVLMMVPEPWENNTEMDRELRAFYEFHSMFMEPWDGPMNFVFTDGTLVGGVLDRNGLRPSRYWVTDDGLVVLSSESGVLDLAPERVLRKGRVRAGPHVSGRHRGRRDRRRPLVQGRPRRRSALSAVAGGEHGPHVGPTRPEPTCGIPTPRSLGDNRSSATPRKSCACCSLRWPNWGSSRWARWGRTRRSRHFRTALDCSSTISPRPSLRSRTPRWTRFEKKSSPRSAPPPARSTTC